MTLGTVVGYPHGGQLLSVKAFEASKALEQGATQIDFVINGGALASGDDETVFNDMLAVVDMAHSALAAAGVIVEADPMTEDLVRRACHLAERAGADYVVTGGRRARARAHTVARTRVAARQRRSADRGQGLGPVPQRRAARRRRRPPGRPASRPC